MRTRGRVDPPMVIHKIGCAAQMDPTEARANRWDAELHGQHFQRLAVAAPSDLVSYGIGVAAMVDTERSVLARARRAPPLREARALLQQGEIISDGNAPGYWAVYANPRGVYNGKLGRYLSFVQKHLFVCLVSFLLIF